MNFVSSVFSNPSSPTDQSAVDLLETLFSGEVRAIRRAKNRDEACRHIEQLRGSLAASKKLSAAQIVGLQDWLEILLNTIPPEDRAGLRFS